MIIISGALALGLAFVVIFIRQNLNSSSPIPTQNLETPAPSFEGQLPKPKILGAAIKNEVDIPILMYHHIGIIGAEETEERDLYLDPLSFQEEADYLAQENYQVITLSELFNDTPGKKVVLTFDDGYKDAVVNALPILKKYGFRGVVFIIVNNVGKLGYMGWNDLAELKNEGWEIGSHSLTHPDFEYLSDDEAKRQIIESKKILEEKLNTKIEYFCYPSGKYNEKTIPILKSAEYLGAVTTNYGRENLKANIFELKRIRILNTETLYGFKSIFD